VLVRRAWRETEADLWLRPPAEVREFLERWLRATDSADSEPGENPLKIKK
jgi:hypothetical protein